jgi:hypothetical protein
MQYKYEIPLQAVSYASWNMLLDKQAAHTLPIHWFYEPCSKDRFQGHKVDLRKLLLRITLKHLLSVSYH